jgi:DHA1 family bicyclomycin/chloramphenicol resistance-like MFS transporter
VLIVWIYVRLPETIHAEDRTPLSFANIKHAFGLVLTNRVALGYMLAMALVMGGLFGFINSAEQIFVDVFQVPHLFTTIFAAIAGAIGAASLLNARFVGRLGMRVVSHGALFGYIAVGAVHVIVAVAGHETVWTFAAFQAAMTFFFGLMSSNFGAMAMEPMAHVAGTAASVQGVLTILGGGIAGFLIGQLFNGTTIPLAVGFFVLGVLALVLVLFAEKGRLFQATHATSKTSG